MVIELVLLILGAYLLGSVPAAYVVARLSRGVDLRQFGSGSVGATNVGRLTSKWIGIAVGVFDLVKGMVLVWVAQVIGLGVIQQVAVGLAAIIGHNWSVFLRFSGGRGVLTALGVALILPSLHGEVPWGGIIGLILTGIGLFVFHNMPLGVFAGVTALPMVAWGFGRPLSIVLGFVAIFLTLVIRRLALPRAVIASSTGTGQLLLNRLLFDRDIRDREAWIYRKPEQQEK